MVTLTSVISGYFDCHFYIETCKRNESNFVHIVWCLLSIKIKDDNKTMSS